VHLRAAHRARPAGGRRRRRRHRPRAGHRSRRAPHRAGRRSARHRHAVLLVAEATDGPLARTAVLPVPVEVAAFPSWLPHLRVPLLVLGVLLGGRCPRVRRLATVSHLTPVPTATYGVGGMEKPKDYYQLLGVPRDASLTAIKRAFRRLARRFDPRSVDGASDTIAELQAAYETLADAERRSRYDDELGRRGAPDGDRLVLRAPSRAGDLRRPFAPASLTAEILLEPEQAGTGTVSLPRRPGDRHLRRMRGHGRERLRLRPLPGRGEGGPAAAGGPCTFPPACATGRSSRCGPDDPAVPSILLTVHVRQA